MTGIILENITSINDLAIFSKAFWLFFLWLLKLYQDLDLFSIQEVSHQL